MEHSEFMRMLYWFGRPIKQNSTVDCFSCFAKETLSLNISFAFNLPGATSEFQSDACSHELVPPICILALPCCCGWEKQKEEAIHLKRAKFSIAEEMATG